MLLVEDVSLDYYGDAGTLTALKNISFQFRPGRSYAFIGPSGCGKTSLLFLLAGLRFPTSGRVLWHDHELRNPPPDMALILQDYGLFPWKNVWDNAVLGLQLQKLARNQQHQVLFPILKDLGLAEFINSYPTTLSGGQRQRVAIARALALQPEVLLMDEPLSALDALTREHLQDTILEIWKQKSITMILVTHNIEEAVYLGQEILVFTSRPGQLRSVVKNSSAGKKQYREEVEFYRQCTRIRQILEEGNYDS